MQPEDQKAPKLLFILSAADGELFNAMYMVMGCGFRTVFALRNPSFSLNKSTMPGKSYSYETLSDLLPIIEAEAPDVVCLFSGYLLVSDEITDDQELDRFIEQMHGRGTRVITSDPFLGLMSRLPMFDPHNPFDQFLAMPVRLVGMLLFGPQFPYFLATASNLRSLKRVPHVYVVDPEEPGEIQRMAFFNPYIRRYSTNAPSGKEPASWGPYWLFILGALEYRSNMNSCGAPGFHSLLAQKLRETLAEGRKPVVIAPPPCIAALAADPSLSDSVLLHNCDYHRYMELLVGAEYAFYWNIFSASIIARLLNCGPTFFFGRGHLGDANHQLFEKGMSRYYADATLTYLDHTDKLSQPDLARQAVLQEAQLFNPLNEHLSRLPTPNEIIRQLLQDWKGNQSGFPIGRGAMTDAYRGSAANAT